MNFSFTKSIACHWHFQLLVCLALLSTLAIADLVKDVNQTVSGKLVIAARSQVGVTTEYNPAYIALDYPGGDVPKKSGVCTDVIIRAFRAVGTDLQKLVHEDMKANFQKYPQRWGLTRPDKNIDHRRVPNLQTFFERKGGKLKTGTKRSDFLPGDLIVWDLNDRGLLHIGIISDRKSADETPLILHNIGSGAREENVLFDFTILAHYRWFPEEPVEKD